MRNTKRQILQVLVTGGAGFIGSAVVRQLIEEEPDWQVVNVDALTYAGNLGSVAAVADNPHYRFERGDIRDRAFVERLFREHRPDAVMHLAAESHVDRSISGPAEFIDTNVLGTYTLLEAARAYWETLPVDRRAVFRFHHISTDEVYGSLGPEGRFTEGGPYRPNSPYAASKASSDHLVRAWHHTYGLPVITSNCSNNYGPYQFPEKLIPLTILNALEGRQLPVYGKGENVRDWLYVEDHARALRLILKEGKIGETYNVGGRSERRNIDVVHAICDLVHETNKSADASSVRHPRDLIVFVEDRPGHDRRYAIDDRKIERELGWRPRDSFETGLAKTVRWYLDNPQWVADVRTGAYREWLEHNYGSRRSIP